MGFDIAKRGIMTAQKGLDISGQNLVNWDSDGYTRQRLDLVSLNATGQAASGWSRWRWPPM